MKATTIAVLLGLLGLVLVLPACNTVRGLGKDIHDGAAGVQDWLDESGTQKTAQK